MLRRKGILLLATLAVAGLLAACGARATPLAEGPAEPPARSTELPAATDGAEPTPLVSTDAPSGGATPTARAGQEATDPTSVHLASGRPTLVKFFAFW